MQHQFYILTMEPSIDIRAISPAPDGVTLQHVDERLALAFEDETFVSMLIISINILSNHAIKLSMYKINSFHSYREEIS